MCQLFSVCEAAREATRLGKVGEIIARVGTSNASGWLGKQSRKMRRKVMVAGREGGTGGDCEALYPCLALPLHYKQPGIEGKTQGDNIAASIVQLSNMFNSF